MRGVLFVVLIVLLSACSSLTPTGQLYKKYAEAARQVGITPVYPPREEFQVGDVFLVSIEPDDPNSAIPVWLGSSEKLREEAEKFLQTRVVFAKTGVDDPNARSLVLKSEVLQDDLFSPEILTRGQVRELSLPIAAFPSFQTQAGMTASTGLVGVLAALGLGGTDETTVTLDFNDVRTYWVPQVIASEKENLKEAFEFARSKADIGAKELPRLVAAREYNEKRKSKNRCVRVSVVNRVYLTRQIDYTYRDRAILAAGLKFATEERKLASVAAPPSITVNVLKTTTTGADPDTQFTETAKIAEELRTAVYSATSGTTEGGSFSFVSWNARGLTFRQTYQRPVAIGWEGFTFDLSPRMYGDHPSCLGIGH